MAPSQEESGVPNVIGNAEDVQLGVDPSANVNMEAGNYRDITNSLIRQTTRAKSKKREFEK